MQVIRLPNGHLCSVAIYVADWKRLKALEPTALVRGFDHFASQASDILREMRFSIHDKINRHVPGYGMGRKWDPQWQIETRRAANALNHPRLVIDWLPPHLKTRFAHRLRANMVD